MILVISPKNVYAAARILAECRIQNEECRMLSVEELVVLDFKVNINQYSCLYIRNPYFKGSPKYIPEVIRLAKKFRKPGKKVVDANIASGNLGEGKWKDYLMLRKAGVSMPETILDAKKSYILHPKSYILKWIFGMKARGTFLIKTEDDLKKIPSIIPKNELMLQEYVEADYEYKVITVGYKALPVVLRFEYNKQFGRVNYDSVCSVPIYGPAGKPINRHATLVKIAERASKTLGRELAKVDVVQKGNKFYVLEVNRFPGLKSVEELTKYNVTRDFVAYLRK